MRSIVEPAKIQECDGLEPSESEPHENGVGLLVILQGKAEITGRFGNSRAREGKIAVQFREPARA